MSKRKNSGLPLITVRQLAQQLRQHAAFFELEADWLDDYHGYSQMFDFTAGSHVFLNVLTDALRHRGTTIEQFRRQWAERKAGAGE